MIAIITRLLNRKPRYRYTVTNCITTECTVIKLTIAEADSYRNRGYWVE